MIKSFSCHNTKFEDYFKKISGALAERELGKIINVSSADSEVKITFTKLGKSELIYNLSKSADGFECIHKSEKLAITHRALRKEMEAKFSGVLQKYGAEVELG